MLSCERRSLTKCCHANVRLTSVLPCKRPPRKCVAMQGTVSQRRPNKVLPCKEQSHNVGRCHSHKGVAVCKRRSHLELVVAGHDLLGDLVVREEAERRCQQPRPPGAPHHHAEHNAVHPALDPLAVVSADLGGRARARATQRERDREVWGGGCGVVRIV